MLKFLEVAKAMQKPVGPTPLGKAASAVVEAVAPPSKPDHGHAKLKAAVQALADHEGNPLGTYVEINPGEAVPAIGVSYCPATGEAFLNGEFYGAIDLDPPELPQVHTADATLQSGVLDALAAIYGIPLGSWGHISADDAVPDSGVWFNAEDDVIFVNGEPFDLHKAPPKLPEVQGIQSGSLPALSDVIECLAWHGYIAKAVESTTSPDHPPVLKLVLHLAPQFQDAPFAAIRRLSRAISKE